MYNKGLKFNHNESDFSLGIFGCYLPPDSYKYGQDGENFFNEAGVIWENLSDCDLLIGAGDVNARTKELLDYLPEVDGSVPARYNPDKTKNAHGDLFLTFLKDNRAIILNGRVTPQLNDYTFVSPRGSSVPDYIFSAIDHMNYCSKMETLLIKDIVNFLHLPPPPSIPDHSILSGQFVASFFKMNRSKNNSDKPSDCSLYAGNIKIPRKNLKKINDEFFMSEDINNAVIKTISRLETLSKNQREINQLWAEIKYLFLNEMERLPDLPSGQNKKLRQSFRKSKPFWNHELASLWTEVCKAEKIYLSCKVTNQAQNLQKTKFRQNFKTAQKQFDKKCRFFKRQHMNKNVSIMYDLAKNKSPNLWEKIKKLNSPPSRPNLEIIREDGSVSRDTEEILNKWFTDISRLYSGVRDNPEMVFDEDFHREILARKAEFENISREANVNLSAGDLGTTLLNADITYNEVSSAIDNTRIGKAYLSIPNDVLKNENAKRILHKFFTVCFASGLNPVEWDYSDIKPIPKPEKDSRDPLQNRCITILCCVAKVYTSILNKRIQSFLESSKILVDEQNGFRSGRSCIDHLYALVTILRNRKEMGKDTFLAFVDFKTAFDLVDRNMLLYKLAITGIRGRMYTAISSLYNNPQSRVVLNDHETNYFNCPMGVKQGDCLSPTLFALYINDLATEIKDSNIGVKLDCLDGSDILGSLGLLLYADDIVCLAECEEELQNILFIVEQWCRRWRLEVNLTKTNIMHIRRQRRTRSRFTFLFDYKPVPYCNDYKYLGSNINEHLSFKFTVEKHSQSAGRALSAIITKMIKNHGFPLNVYSLLLSACVNSVSDYSAAITGFDEYDSLTKVQLRAIRAFLGLPKNASNPAVLSEVDLLLPHFRTR